MCFWNFVMIFKKVQIRLLFHMMLIRLSKAVLSAVCYIIKTWLVILSFMCTEVKLNRRTACQQANTRLQAIRSPKAAVQSGNCLPYIFICSTFCVAASTCTWQKAAGQKTNVAVHSIHSSINCKIRDQAETNSTALTLL